jgi:hypothetical protein
MFLVSIFSLNMCLESITEFLSSHLQGAISVLSFLIGIQDIWQFIGVLMFLFFIPNVIFC